MPTITLESSERSKRKSRVRSNLRSYGTRHGDSFWEEEKSRNNFGLKYMNKLGWSKGDGLGRNRQGNTNHIKTKLKNDNKGIGCRETPNNTMFQATMCMFNDILSGLNKKKDPNASDSSANKSNTKHVSASAVIKSYEAKHHLYGKFRAAKNISNRSEQDKAELFGNVESKGFTENDQTNYALRMSELSSGYSGKMGLGFGQNDAGSMDTSALMFGKFTRSGIITRKDIIGDETEKEAKEDEKMNKKKKKKKSKKNKKSVSNSELNGDKKTKKKKKKKKNIDMNIVIQETINPNVINVETNQIKTKKKKKKKKRKLEIESLNEPPLKKRKLNVPVTDGDMSDVSSTASILSAVQTPVQSDVEINEEEANEKKKKKKKKRKKDKSKKKDKKKRKK